MSEQRRHQLDGLLLALLCVSLGINVFAVWAVVKARNATTIPSIDTGVVVGTNLKPIVGMSPEGQPVTVSFERTDRPLVLYVFSSQCVWCDRNVESIRALGRSAGTRYRFVGLSLPAAESRRIPSLGFPVVEPREPVPFRSTPQTLVVGASGRVQRSWMGAYTGTTKLQLEQYFEVALPDIQVRDTGGQR